MFDQFSPTGSGELSSNWVGTPVLMRSALMLLPRGLPGLKLGAGDYLSKPVGFDELIARIEALLRRENDLKPSPDSIVSEYEASASTLDHWW